MIDSPPPALAGPLHLIQRLYLAEDLVRRRRADEERRHVASQRSARVDPNPHQIDAVIFALTRLGDGGCILADEVGLGKTIEAGLVIAQLRAEGAQRVLVVTPKALLGQWKQELFSLFAIDAHEVARGPDGFAGTGVFLAARDLVGSEAGAARLQAAERFDLCVIDEAHEVFAGIYKRFDRHGSNREDSPMARMAGRLSQAIRDSGTPVLLLTATPIQNSLLELWGLVHYIDPTGTLLGDLSTFRELFCPSDPRVLAEGQAHELHRRLATVLKRTLRRQAQEFMREPFMGRQARLFDYAMSPEERALYDDLTSYLLEPTLHAFRGNQRKLLLIGFHRRMASSIAALGKSLGRVAARLRELRDGRPPDDAADRDALLGDPDDDEAGDDAAGPAPPAAAASIGAELARVEGFVARARALPTDSKARALVSAVRLVMDQAEVGRSKGKVVIFTEFLATQEYLRQLLLDSRLVGDGDITLFRGSNDLPRQLQALARWGDEVGSKMDPASRPSPDVAMRLALVHEFRTASRILISTESGAKGLNLQFCDTVINYDLPWNPQRIEQRIGRCHRYAQQRDVTVINFIARDNEAQQLTFEILSQKLDLFGTVLGASDEVLHRPGPIASESLVSAVGGDFEAQLNRIYDRARSHDEVVRELRELRDAMDSKRREFESAQQRTDQVIQSRFDASVREVFARIQEALPRELAEFDRQVQDVVTGYLDALGVGYRFERQPEGAELVVPPSPRLPAGLADGVHCLVGTPIKGSPLTQLHLGHPLVLAALSETRTAARAQRFVVTVHAGTPEGQALRGQRGRLRLVRVRYRGFETTEQLLPVVVLDGSPTPLPVELARALLAAPIADAPAPAPRSAVTDAELADALDELRFLDPSGASEQPRFERTLEQVERFMSDRILLLERRRDAVVVTLGRAETARDAAVGAEQRDRAEAGLRRAQDELEQLDADLARLRAGDDATYQRWRQRTEERRYPAPEIEALLDAELVIT